MFVTVGKIIAQLHKPNNCWNNKKEKIMENTISYDYKTIKVKRSIETLVCDTYENLGWEMTNTSSVEGSIFYVNLSFKRDRKIANKTELLKLQEKADSVIASIEALQNKQKNSGLAEAVTTGTIGALTFGGGMSMCLTLSGVGFMIGGIALGVVGAGICALAYPLFKKLNKKKSSNIQPILESEFDKLADICEQAANLR